MTLAEHWQECILAAVLIAFVIIYIWYRTETGCPKCPYRIMSEPVEYSEDNLEEME